MKPALEQYDRQRRTIANTFVQAQTIANKQMMEIDDGEDSKTREKNLTAIVNDPERRRAYLMRQSMYESLADEATIS